MTPNPKISEMWTPAEKAEKTMASLLAVCVVDEGGMYRVIKWSDMSYASEWIARDNQGAVVLLKIRAWS